MDEFEIEERDRAFYEWVGSHSKKMSDYLMPPNREHKIHEMLRKAFNAGSNYERKRNEPVHCGGNN